MVKVIMCSIGGPGYMWLLLGNVESPIGYELWKIIKYSYFRLEKEKYKFYPYGPDASVWDGGMWLSW